MKDEKPARVLTTTQFAEIIYEYYNKGWQRGFWTGSILSILGMLGLYFLNR